MLDAPEDIFPNVLAALGLKPDSKRVDDLDKAGERQTSPLASWLMYSDEWNFCTAPRMRNSASPALSRSNGDVCLSVGYSGDVIQARKRAQEAKSEVEVAYLMRNSASPALSRSSTRLESGLRPSAASTLGKMSSGVRARLGSNQPLNTWDIVLRPELIAKLKDCGVTMLVDVFRRVELLHRAADAEQRLAGLVEVVDALGIPAIPATSSRRASAPRKPRARSRSPTSSRSRAR
jgi:spermidine/putrescine-binding protein